MPVSGYKMLSALSVRTLLRLPGLGVYRLKLSSASCMGKSSEVDDYSREDGRRRTRGAPIPEPPRLEINTKVHQRRGSGADTFGDLPSIVDVPADFVEGDEADKAEGTTYTREEDRERRRVHYAKLITELLAEKKLTMALEVLETEMKKTRVQPNRKIFADLITFCGKVGYPQKAFELFTTSSDLELYNLTGILKYHYNLDYNQFTINNRMRKRGYRVTGGIYTSLFNACGNCPKQDVGLKHAHHFKKKMDDQRWKPNAITYHAMIKAFGRSGDLETAFSIGDQIMRDRVPLRPETLSFLLQACVSNKETGFLRALQVWHKMLLFKLKPNVFSYNLLLRSVRDTGLGDLESMNTVFKQLMPEKKSLKIAAKVKGDVHVDDSDKIYPWDLAKPDFVHGSSDSQPSTHKQSISAAVPSARPDLLSLKPTLNGLVITGEINTAAMRLLLLGGSQGVIESMLANGVEPNINTFTLLLDCIPHSSTAEEALLKEIKTHKVEPDTGFFNALICRRGRRKDFKRGFDVLDIMKEYNVEIDTITIHSLAYCVTDIPTFQKFLDDIVEAGFGPTTPMLGSVLKNALHQTHFRFIFLVMDAYQKYEIPVHKRTFEQLEEFYKRNLRLLKGKDNPPKDKEKFYSGEYFKTSMKVFIIKISDWKRRVKLDETSDANYFDQFNRTGKEAQNVEPYIEKWRKGSRYAEWRTTKPPGKKSQYSFKK